MMRALEERPVTVLFDEANGSSDGGAILLAAANQRYGDGTIESWAEYFVDGTVSILGAVIVRVVVGVLAVEIS